jgi:hypothetical protein
MYPFQPNYDKSTTFSRIAMAYFRDVKRWEVKDRTDDDVAQKAGFDFYLQGRTTEFKSCDQIHRTGNLVFELVSNSRKPSAGCGLTSEAQLLCYYDTVGNIAHLIAFQQLRRAIEASSQRKWSAYKVTTPMPHSLDIAYATFGLLVPLVFLQQEDVWHRTFNLKGYLGSRQSAGATV